MLTGLRGLAQSFVRGAVAIGRAATKTYTALTELGLGYVRSQFDIDWGIYDQQKAFVQLAREMPSDQLISGAVHGESLLNLTCKFKYDVSAVYESLTGKTLKLHWSVISDVRMTQDEIMETAQTFVEGCATAEFPFHAEVELEGIWTRKAALA